MKYVFEKIISIMKNLESERTIGFLSKGKNRKKSKSAACRKITSSTVRFFKTSHWSFRVS